MNVETEVETVNGEVKDKVSPAEVVFEKLVVYWTNRELVTFEK